jgi:hypothetical protein
MGLPATTGAGPCKLTSAPPTNVQCDYLSSPGNVSFSVAIFSGSGSVAFSAFSIDGNNQPLTNSLTANLPAGKHKLTFVLAFSDPGAIAVIREACNPAHDLVLVDASSPFETLRICVS